MDHGYFQDRLSAYLDGELTPEETRALAEHLQSCVECRRRLEDLRRFEKLVDEHSELGESDYWERSARRIEERLGAAAPEPLDIRPSARRPSSADWWRIAGVAAAIVLVGYVGLHRDEILHEIEAPRSVERTTPTPAVHPDTSAVVSQGGYNDLQDDYGAAGEPGESPTAPALKEETAPPQPAVDHDFAGETPPPAPPRASARVPAAGSEQADVKPVAPSPATDKLEPEAKNERIYVVQEAPGILKPADREKTAVSPEASTDEAGAVTQKAKARKSATATETKEAESTEGVVAYRRGSKEPPEYVPTGDITVVDHGDSLAYWREKLNALTAAKDTEVKARARLVPRTYGETGKTTALTQSPMTAANEARQEKKTDPFLQAWFNICRFSTDSVEVAQGRHLLDSVAADTTSPSCDIAKGYVEKLTPARTQP